MSDIDKVVFEMFFCFRVSDDKFFIYAALSHPSTFLVSGDELGDYHHTIPSPVNKYFKKWQRNKQIWFQHSRDYLHLNVRKVICTR